MQDTRKLYSKEERKTTNLKKERGRETSLTLSAAKRLPFLSPQIRT